MKKIVLLFILGITFLNVNAQKQKSAISIGPATLNFHLEQGQSSTQTVYIYNKLSKPYSFTLDISDWGLDSAGKDVFMDVGNHPNSCARWITLDRKSIEVPGNSREGVDVTLTIPDSAYAVKEARWAMLNINLTSERKAPRQIGAVDLAVSKSLAVGVRIYQVPNSPQLTKEMKMTDFRALKDSNHYRIESKNTGSTMLRCHYSIELSSQETGEKITVGPEEALVLPGQNRFVDLKLPDSLAKGKYTAIALIETGDDEVPLEAAQTEIEIK